MFKSKKLAGCRNFLIGAVGIPLAGFLWYEGHKLNKLEEALQTAKQWVQLKSYWHAHKTLDDFLTTFDPKNSEVLTLKHKLYIDQAQEIVDKALDDKRKGNFATNKSPRKIGSEEYEEAIKLVRMGETLHDLGVEKLQKCDDLYYELGYRAEIGPKLLFHTYPDKDTWNISMANADGSNKRVLVDSGDYPYETKPGLKSWSTNGTKIAFLTHRFGVDTLHALNVYTGNTWEVVRVNSSFHNTGNNIVHPPSWSPDGERLALSIEEDDNWNIYAVDVGGGNLKKLTTSAEDNHFPSWSPDGKSIAYIAKQDVDEWLYIMGANGENKKRLAKAGYSCPSWSPDGKSIAFVSRRDHLSSRSGKTIKMKRSNVWVVDVSDGSQSLLTDEEYVGKAAWSPDGQMIAYTIGHGDQEGIHVIGANGKNSKKLVGISWEYGSASARVGSWSPDGMNLSYTLGRGRDALIFSRDIVTGLFLGSTLTKERLVIRGTDPKWSPY